LGFQPEIIPSSLTKMSFAGSELVPLLTLKTEVLFQTVPVGFAPSVLVALRGIVMTSGLEKLGAGVPFSKYSVATPVPLSATNIVSNVGETARPHGFTTCRSVISPTPWTSDWRFSQSKLPARANPAVTNNVESSRVSLREVRVVFMVFT
jgi:hypothetical protein